MNLSLIVKQLQVKQALINQALAAIQQLQLADGPKKRGRPSRESIELQKMLNGQTPNGKRRGRPPGSKNKPK